jgi:hypothetical protein
MYDIYMNDPSTPIEVKRAKKSVVMRILRQRAIDHYQTVQTNDTVAWRFKSPGKGKLSVRMRFTNQFDMRQDLIGEFLYGDSRTTISNITQAVLKMPLSEAVRAGDSTDAEKELKFSNFGKTALMLRPRKDINLLVSADSFWCNLFRAWLELCAILTLLIAAGVFLSSGLGRPVALFVALSVLLVGEISPSVIEQYPDELESKAVDRIGLMLTRYCAQLTKPFSSLSPLEALSKDECVEPDEVIRVLIADCLVFPVLFCMLAAFLMPRKQT